ncbi:MAG: RNA pseudouridine synthase, partial [Firmicutes bacterium]|nr:RNA pseudouridine synthase [Bacillota bacterium]
MMVCIHLPSAADGSSAVASSSRERFTLVRVQILTGRTHQIRLHLAEAGYPILGDPKYGNNKLNEQMKKQ